MASLSFNVKSLLVVTALFLLRSAIAQGTLSGRVEEISFQSDILGVQRHLLVYLPPGYDTETSTVYPITYFLHGFIGNHTTFGYINNVLDRMIVDGTMPPIILAMPNGAVAGTVPPIGSLWVNSVVNGNFEDYFLNEVIPLVETNYRVDKNRNKRMIMGHSFGASASVRLATENLDIFGSVACHSGFVQMDQWLVQLYVNTSVFNENNSTAVPLGLPPGALLGQNKIFTLFVITAASAWSPNLASPTLYDLPMVNDGSGTLVPDVVTKWESFSPHVILQSYLERLRGADKLNLLYLDIGNQDELELLPPNLDFAALLLSWDVEYQLKIYTGPHNNKTILETRFEVSLSEWGKVLFAQQEVQEEESTGLGTGAIVGIVVACIVFVAIVAVLVAFVVVKMKWHVLFLEKEMVEKDEEL